ncbi:MAG TPA: EamA family transporter, partial [Chitinophagaceae bacterium]|nr:EamA family transporter [Chitinophagaceae bacterium]
MFFVLMKKAYWQLHAAIFLWGFTGVLGRAITLAESWLVWWRLCITVVSLWILFAWLKKITIIPRKFMLQVAGIGCILALHWLCFYGSIKYANVSIALTCLATSGLFSSVLEPLYFRTKIKLQEVFFGLMALAGITIIYFDNLQVSTGVYIGLAASLLTVTVSILNK